MGPTSRKRYILPVRFLIGCCLGLAICADPGPTEAEGTEAPDARAETNRSRAEGSPSRGSLVRGVALRPSDHLQRLRVYRGSANRYATVELLGLLERAAAAVAEAYPGSVLRVGDLSAERGGRIPWHRSHQNGRDADLSFYMRHEDGHSVEASGFVHFGDDGVGIEPLTMLRFDDARNFVLVRALIEDEIQPAHLVFVSRGLEARLLAEGERQGVSDELMDRLRRTIRQPRVRHPHRNHFHIRIACPANDRPRCRDR
ncbi:MAG: penicillin-insensitive murein endopeptidase [Myxococcota bacterium]